LTVFAPYGYLLDGLHEYSALLSIRLYGPLPLVLGERAGRGASAGDSIGS
jgi:hypothetical protein